MSTDYQTKILEALGDGATLEEIETSTKLPYKTLRAPLASLLNKEVIRISGFSKDTKFNLKKIEFRKRPPHNTSTEIIVLLNIFEGNDGYKAKEAREELEELFEKKYREYEEEEKNFYNSLLPRVKHIPITEEHNEYNNHIKNISEEAQAFYELNKDKYKNNLSLFSRMGQEWMFLYEDPKAPNPQPHKDFRKYRKLYNDLKRLQLDYTGASRDGKVWRVPDLTPEEAMKIAILKYSRNIQIIGNEFRGFNDVSNEILTKCVSEIIESKMEWIDLEGSGTPESYLDRWKFKINKATPDEVFEAFNSVWFFVDVHKNREALKRHFAYALSDEKGSSKWFELFMIQVMNEPFNLSFQRDMGIEELKLL